MRSVACESTILTEAVIVVLSKEDVFVLHVFLKASQYVPCLVRFQHPLSADDLAVGFALVHLGVNSLVLDAVELCIFGDCLKLMGAFVQQTMQSLVCCVQCSIGLHNLAFVSVSMALISMSSSTRRFFMTLSRVSALSSTPDESCNIGANS